VYGDGKMLPPRFLSDYSVESGDAP